MRFGSLLQMKSGFGDMFWSRKARNFKLDKRIVRRFEYQNFGELKFFEDTDEKDNF